MDARSFSAGSNTTVMGIKERHLRPLPENISLEELVPKDNFYRHLEAQLDLSVVRELVCPLYADGGPCTKSPL